MQHFNDSAAGQKQVLRSRYADLSIICIAVAIFALSAVLYYSTHDALRLREIFALALAAITSVAIIAKWAKYDGWRALGETLGSPWFRWATIAAIIAVALRIGFLEAPLYWDSALFFYALKRAAIGFNFSVTEFVNAFGLAYHFSYAYTAILLIGYFFCPASTIGIGLVRLAIYIPCVYMIFYILRKISGSADNRLLTIATVFVTVAPLQLGVFPALNLDYPLMVFSVYFLFSLVSKRNVCLAASCALIVFSKEPGMVFVAGALLGFVLLRLLRRDSDGGIPRLRKALCDSRAVIMFCAIAIGAICFLSIRIGGQSWTGQTPGSPTPIPVMFGLSFSYVRQKLITFFIFNFEWIYLAVAAISLIFLAVFRFHRLKQPHCKHGRYRTIPADQSDAGHERLLLTNAHIAFGCYISGVLALAAFHCFYITLNLPRYGMPIETGLALLAAIALLYVISRCSRAHALAIKTTLCVVSALIAIEAFVPIDIVTKSIGATFPIGQATVGYVPQKGNAFTSGGDVESAIMFNNGAIDEAIYNSQLLHRGELIDECLYRANYNEDVDIIVWLSPYLERGFVSVGGGLGALDPDGNEQTLGLKWDPKKGKRVLPDASNDDAIEIAVLNSSSFYTAHENDALHSEAILLIDPMIQRGLEGQEVTDTEGLSAAIAAIVNELDSYYEISEPHWISNAFNTEMCYYKLVLK